MRVLVTGASGLLGGRLASLLGQAFVVVGGRHEKGVPPGLEAVPFDLLSLPSMEAALSKSRPDAIVHAAALANPDICERQKERALALNVEGPRALARLSRRSRIRLVAISTDLVFPGEGGPWDESARPDPLLFYGKTKCSGEDAVLSEDPGAAVARVALVSGRGFGPRATASESVLWSLRAGRRPRLYTDQFRTPIDPDSVASCLKLLLGGSQSGLFHLGGPERLSRYELGMRTAALMGLDGSLIEAAREADGPTLGRRPADVSLVSGRALRELGWVPRPLDQALLESRRSAEESGGPPGGSPRD